MVNIVIGLIGIVLVALAIKSSIKHIKGESACCGGGSGIIATQKTLEGTKLGEKTITIEGMTCENCQKRVQNALNKIDGIAAKVSWKKGNAIVEFDREIADNTLKNAVEQVGYSVISIA